VENRRAVFILMLVFMFLLLQVPNAHSSESNANEELYEFLSSESPANAKLFDFLSNVVGLDLTKYAVVPPSVVPPGFEGLDPLEFYKKLSEHVSTQLPSSNFTRDDLFGGLVEEEVPSFDFEYNNNKIDVMGIFYNEHMNYLGLTYYGQEDYVYSEPQPTDILGRAERILERYQTFASQNYGKDASYVVPMLNVLSSVSDLSPKEFTEGNITFQVTKKGDKTRINWIYTEGGISMNWKRLSIEFCNNSFESFRDSWGLYSVSGLSKISREEAVQIALEAAQQLEIRIGHEDRETEIVKVPDLSNAPYDVNLYMVPFRFEERDFPSNMTRDPLTLYPYWQLHFYFNESIAGNVGVQVGVWGDTGEIIYCSGHGYLGSSGPSSEQDTTEQPTDDHTIDEQKQVNTSSPSTLAVTLAIVAVPIVMMIEIALGLRNRHKQQT